MDHTKETDEKLVLLVREGDSAAEAELVERHKPLVTREARPYFLRGGEMEDLVEEGMFGLLSAIRTYKEGENASFSTYATTCIRNTIFEAIRKAGAKKHNVLSDAATFEEDEEAFADPVDLYEERAEIRSLMEGFTDLERQVFKNYLAGYNYQEIAERIGKDEKSVDNTVQRIRKKVIKNRKSIDK